MDRLRIGRGEGDERGEMTSTTHAGYAHLGGIDPPGPRIGTEGREGRAAIVELSREHGEVARTVVDAGDGKALLDQPCDRAVGLGPCPPVTPVDPDHQR
jgi:hypothetical protein